MYFLLISTAISKRLLCSLFQILTQLCAGSLPAHFPHIYCSDHPFFVLSPTCAAMTPSFCFADMFWATKIALRGNRVQIAWETAQASEKQEKDSYQISNISGIWVKAFGTGLAYSYGNESMHTTNSIPLLHIFLPKLRYISKESL